MYNIKFVYLFSENVSPALFAKIIRPSVAGQWIMSVPDNSLRSLFTRYDLLRTITGANPYQSGRDTRKLIAQDLDMGRILIDLSDDVIQRLDNLKQLRNRPRAELLREAIEQYLDQQSSSVIRDALGLWGNQQEDGLEYERKLREEW